VVDRFHSWTPAVGCGDGPLPGATALQAAALQRWAVSGATSLGIFNCRRVGGGLAWSVHAEGRAGDIGIRRELVALGDQLLAALRGHNWELGLQRIIFRRRIYDASRPTGAPFSDDGAHDEHLHWEQTWDAALHLSQAQANLLLAPSAEDEDDARMDLIVRWGGLWVVAQDLSSKTPLASTADVNALQASGKYRLTALTPAQMVKIPTVDAVDDGDV